MKTSIDIGFSSHVWFAHATVLDLRLSWTTPISCRTRPPNRRGICRERFSVGSLAILFDDINWCQWLFMQMIHMNHWIDIRYIRIFQRIYIYTYYSCNNINFGSMLTSYFFLMYSRFNGTWHGTSGEKSGGGSESKVCWTSRGGSLNVVIWSAWNMGIYV